MTLYYNSLVWTTNPGLGVFGFNQDEDWPCPGFRLDQGLLKWNQPVDQSTGQPTGPATSGVLIEPDGAKHPLIAVAGSNSTLWQSRDATYIRVQRGAGGVDTVTYKNGTQVTYQTYGVTAHASQNVVTSRPVQKEDSNGNFITIAYQNDSDTSISSIIDTAGRKVTFTYGSNGLLASVSQGQRTFTFTWNNNYTLNYNFQSVAVPTVPSGTSGISVLSEVKRPDGTRVQFNWGDWQMVNDIKEFSATGNLRYEESYNFPAASAGPLAGGPTYSTKTIFNGVSTAVWTFNSVTDSHGMVTSFSVTDPLGTTRVTTFSADGLPIQDQIAAQGKPWRTTQTTWTSNNGNDFRSTAITTILDDNTQSQVQLAYDSFFNITNKKETDLGQNAPGAVLRETVTTYAANMGNLVSLPAEIQVLDGNHTIKSRATFAYDGTAVQGGPPILQHDDANYAPTSNRARGNLTATTAFPDAAQSTGPITSTFTYDVFGNRISSQIGCCTQERTSYSADTAFVYPTSASIGPVADQLTTTYTYNLDSGSIISTTGPNGDTTLFAYDVDNRPTTVTTADNVTITESYDDDSILPMKKTISTANSLVATRATDFQGHLVSEQTFDGNTLVATKTFVDDALGRPVQISNLYGPNESAQFTSYTFDPLGRTTLTTPPALNSGIPQNGYQANYSGATITLIDPANKQHREYMDGLGRLVRVDEPGGASDGTAASGSVPIQGSLQTTTVGGHSATSATGAVTISGTLQFKQLLSQGATPASGSFTITGIEHSARVGHRCGKMPDITICYDTFWDFGRVTLTVNGFAVSTGYGQNSTAAAIASDLGSQLNGSGSPVTASVNGAVINMITKDVGNVNYSISSSVVTNDAQHFKTPSFQASPSGSTLTGGQTDQYNTYYDSGTCTLTVNNHGDTVSWSGSGTTAAGIAAALAGNVNNDNSAFVSASASANTISLTSRAVGASTNVPYSSSCTFDSSLFSHPSFTTSNSGSTLTGGSDAYGGTTVTDFGTVTVAVGSTSATACYGANPDATCNGSNNTTAAQVASDLAAKLAAQNPSFTVNASAANIAIVWKTVGVAGNVAVTGSSKTSQGSFSNPSFTAPGTTLSGGTDPQPASLNSPFITQYRYDPAGNLLQVIQGQQTRTYTYNGLGRLTSSCIPEAANQCAFTTYTDFGAPATRTDPRGIVTTYGYDTLNRPTSMQYSDGTPAVSYTYGRPGATNSTGRLITMSDGTGSESYQYDLMGRRLQVVKTIGGNNYLTSYSYNAAGEPVSLTYPSGRVMNRGYDSIGRLRQVAAGGASLLTINSYNAAGKMLAASYGNGMQATYAYNNQQQIASILYGSSASNVLSLSYDWGGVADDGQVAAIIDNLDLTRSTAYTYDEVLRLKTAWTVDQTSPGSWALSYKYDRFGNRLGETPFGGKANMPSTQITVDPTTNRITSPGYCYDADGDMTCDGLHTYTYDAANRITHVDGPANTYAYDGHNLRVNRKGDYLIYVGDQVIAEYANGAPAASPTTEHIYGGGRRLATISAGSLIYHYWDHLSARVNADASGAVVSTFGHFPWGQTLYQTGTLTPWLFTTYYRDPESNLDYANDRFDSTTLGRFMSLDPVPGRLTNPQTFNRYVYAGNNPVKYSDPSGMEEFDSLEDSPEDGAGLEEGGGGGGGGGWDFGGGGGWDFGDGDSGGDPSQSNDPSKGPQCDANGNCIVAGNDPPGQGQQCDEGGNCPTQELPQVCDESGKCRVDDGSNPNVHIMDNPPWNILGPYCDAEGNCEFLGTTITPPEIKPPDVNDQEKQINTVAGVMGISGTATALGGAAICVFVEPCGAIAGALILGGGAVAALGGLINWTFGGTGGYSAADSLRPSASGSNSTCPADVCMSISYPPPASSAGPPR